MSESVASSVKSVREKLSNVKESLTGNKNNANNNNTTNFDEVSTSDSSDVLEELSQYCPKLTFQQRVAGFFSCFALGYLVTFGSFSLFIELVEGNPGPFVLSYTLGNIFSMLSSTFLCGPKRQFKNMFHETRRYTTIAYICTLVLSLVFCFVPMSDHKLKLCILVFLVMIQFFALLWYCLTYIPFARRTVKRYLKDAMGLNEIV